MKKEDKIVTGARFAMPSDMGFGCYEVFSVVDGHANAQCRGVVQTEEEVRVWVKGRWPEKMVPMVHPGLNGHSKNRKCKEEII